MQAADATCSLAAIWLALGPSHGQEAAQQLRSMLPTVLGNADTGVTLIIVLSQSSLSWVYAVYACTCFWSEHSCTVVTVEHC